MKETKKDFKEVKESQMIKEIKSVNQKIIDENYVLKANMEKLKSSQKQKPFDFAEQIEVKDKEIKSLVFTRKVTVDKFARLQEINQNLEEEIRDLKKFKIRVRRIECLIHLINVVPHFKLLDCL